MPDAVHEERCVVIQPMASEGTLYEDVFKPAVIAAGMRPEPGRQPHTPEDQAAMLEQLASADAVLLDCRDPDDYCLYALGYASALSGALVAIVRSRDALSLKLADEQLIEFGRDLGTNLRAAKSLHGEIKVRLEARIAPPRGAASVASPPRVDQAPRFGEFPIEEAERLVVAMWADGLSRTMIHDELLRAGVSEGWLKSRVGRLRAPLGG